MFLRNESWVNQNALDESTPKFIANHCQFEVGTLTATKAKGKVKVHMLPHAFLLHAIYLCVLDFLLNVFICYLQIVGFTEHVL